MHVMEMRRQRRIIYQTRIRLRAPGRDDSVIARVQNLSPRGVFVIAPDIPAAGTEVQCRFTLAGERRTLRGRVAWVRAASPNEPPQGTGAGIEFLDLDAADQHLLGRLVEPPPEALVAVDVAFEGLAAPVRCRAVVAGDGLRLVTGLPFMRLDSRVAVRFPGSSGEHHVGTIDSVALEPGGDGGIPQLELNVTLDLPVSSDPFTLPVLRAPAPSTVVSASLTAPPPPVTRLVGATGDQTVRVAMGNARLLRAQLDARVGRLLRAVRRQWLSLAAGFMLGAALVAAVIVTWRPAAVSAPRQVSAPPAVAAPAPPGPAPAPPVSPVSPVSPASQPLAAPVAAPVAAAPDELSEPSASSSPASLPPAPAPPAPTPGFTLHTDGRQVRLAMPLIGSGRGSEQYRLVEPPGVAITLPRGRPRVITGVYRPEGGPVRVQVRRRAPGSHLRFFFDPTRYQGTVRAYADQVVLELVERD